MPLSFIALLNWLVGFSGVTLDKILSAAIAGIMFF